MSSYKSTVHTQDLTQGSVIRCLVLFALPLLGSTLVQQLYNSVDLIFVGNILGKEASAAVGSGSLLIACVIDFFVGLGVGITILCAHAFGADDREQLRTVIHTSMVLAVVGGILFTVLGWMATPAVLRWYRVPDSIFDLAVTYMRIYFLGLLSIISFNIGSGILRALGDSRSPMLCQLLGGLANVFGDFLFIYVLRLGVAGAALATMFSQTAAMLLTIRMLFRLPEDYRLSLRHLQFRRHILLRILRIGLPTAVQSMVITFSNLIMQIQINQLGVDSIAAFAAFYKVDAFCYVPLITIGQSMVTFTGQNLGAGRKSRVRQGLHTAWSIDFGIALIIGGTISFLYYPFYRLFSADPDVIRIGGGIAHSAFLYYFLFGYSETLSSTLRGSGRTFGSMLLTLLCIVVLRLPVIYLLFGFFRSAAGMALVYPVTWSFTAICFTVYYLRCRDQITVEG